MTALGTGTELTPDEIAAARAGAQTLGATAKAARTGLRPQTSGPDAEESREAAMGALEALVGLRSAKEKVASLANYVAIEMMRRRRGLPPNPLSLHAVFSGPSGTGKTTVARLLGRLYRAMGALSSGHLVEVTRSRFLSESEDCFQRARDGVLFIDEMYTPVARENLDGSGRAIAHTLLRTLEADREDVAVVMAGSDREIKTFLELNPNVASRFRHRLEFSHYDAAELLEIFDGFCRARSLRLTEAARARLAEALEEICAEREEGFGNARSARMLFEDMLERQANRLVGRALGDDDLATMTADDVPEPRAARRSPAPKSSWDPAAIKVSEPPVGDTLEKASGELEALVGMGEVKAQMHSLVSFLAVQKRRREEGLPVSPVVLHTAFVGPPGTGKTTVARLLGRIYRCLGLLSHGHTVETDRSGLVAGWLGQTALKANETISQALNGVLFIDEAYALGQDHRGVHDWGGEAISVLLKRMEDDRERLAVVVAGYPDEMEKFLDSNAGLRSRFAQTIRFDHYGPEELVEIFERFCREGAYVLEPEARARLAEQLRWLHAHAGREFGNGRLVRTLFEKTIQRQSLRLAGQEAGREALSLLQACDLPEIAGTAPRTRPLGFRQTRG